MKDERLNSFDTEGAAWRPHLLCYSGDARVPGQEEYETQGAVFHPLFAVVEGVGGEEKEDVEEESDAAGEGLVLAEEKDRGRSREKEEIEKHQQGLLSRTITVNADGCRYAEDIVEDHKGGIQHR